MIGKRFIIKTYNRSVGRCLRSALAIILIFSLLLTASYAWLQNAYMNSIDSNGYIAVSADGLIMETIDRVVMDSISVLEPNSEVRLAECTSSDGLNFYFPLSNYDNGAPQAFRMANASDCNTNYIRFEFLITSDKDTDVWLSNQSYILGHAADAIRISLAFSDEIPSTESSVDPDEVVILDGSEEFDSITPLMCLDEEGRVLDCPDNDTHNCPKQTSHSLSRYFFTADANSEDIIKGRELFTLKSGQTKRVTMAVWLEGWDSDCRNKCINNCANTTEDCFCDVYDPNDLLQINLKFTIGMEKYQVLKFSDASYESWLQLKRADLDSSIFSDNLEYYRNIVKRRVFVRDKQSGVLYAMTREVLLEDTSNTKQQMMYHWIATVPSSVFEVEFLRLNHRNGIHLGEASQEGDFEVWAAGTLRGTNGSIYRRFYALDVEEENRGNGETNTGRWTNKSGIATYFFFDTVNSEKCDTFITVSLTFGYYPTADKNTSCEMVYVTTLSSGVNVYAARIPNSATATSSIVITQGSTSYSCPSRNTSQNIYTANGGWSVDPNYPQN